MRKEIVSLAIAALYIAMLGTPGYAFDFGGLLGGDDKKDGSKEDDAEDPGDITIETDCADYATKKRAVYGAGGAILGGLAGLALGDKKTAAAGAVAGAMAGIVMAEKAVKECDEKQAELRDERDANRSNKLTDLKDQEAKATGTAKESFGKKIADLKGDMEKDKEFDKEQKRKTKDYLASLKKEKAEAEGKGGDKG